MNEKKVGVLASFEDDTERMLVFLKGKGIDTTKCCICGKPILKIERSPYYLWERWRAWRHKQKFYEWNIDAYLPKGIVCSGAGCFAEALYRRRNDSSLSKVETK